MLLAASGCMTENHAVLESVIGVKIEKDELRVVVATGGCTEKPDFDVRIDRGNRPGQATFIALTRLRPDNCKGFFPGGKEISYKPSEFGVETTSGLILLNPIVVSPTR